MRRYTALESFQRQKDNYSLLDYENAGIYTGALLDHYMDYKLMWKQLSMATYELEQLRATIEWTQMPEELYKLANIQELPESQKGQKLRQSNLEYNNSKGSRQDALAGIEDALAKGDFDPQAVDRFMADLVGTEVAQDRPTSRWVQLKPFTPTFAGLIKARKLCRVEMAKIVNETDLVTRDPKIALERDRDSYFLHPLVFKQLLPVSFPSFLHPTYPYHADPGLDCAWLDRRHADRWHAIERSPDPWLQSACRHGQGSSRARQILPGGEEAFVAPPRLAVIHPAAEGQGARLPDARRSRPSQSGRHDDDNGCQVFQRPASSRSHVSSDGHFRVAGRGYPHARWH